MVSAEIQKRFGAKHVRREGFGLPRPVGLCIALLLWPVVYLGAALLILAAALQTGLEAVADAVRPARRAACVHAAASVAAAGAYVLHNVEHAGEMVACVCGGGGACVGWGGEGRRRRQRNFGRSRRGCKPTRVALPYTHPPCSPTQTLSPQSSPPWHASTASA